MATTPQTVTPEVEPVAYSSEPEPKPKRGRPPKSEKIPPEPTQELALVRPSNPLALATAPELVLSEAATAAKAIADVIESKPRKIILNGKTYLTFEDWQTLGRFYGVTAVGKTSAYVERGSIRGYEATADALLVSTNQVISHAEAECLSDEFNWSTKPLYQLRSMAQTRACAKALRNVLAWVVVLAGYAPTPAEEVEEQAAAPTSAPTPVPAKESEPDPVTKLTQALVREMKTAASIDQLQKRWDMAKKMCIETRNLTLIKDGGAVRIAKDARKKELANGKN